MAAPSWLDCAVCTAAISVSQWEPVITLFITINDPITAIARNFLITEAFVVSDTIVLAVPSILHFTITIAAVSICFVAVIAVLSKNNIPFTIPTVQKNRIQGIHTLLTISTDPAKLDQTQVATAVSILKITIITDLIFQGFKYSVPTVKSRETN